MNAGRLITLILIIGAAIVVLLLWDSAAWRVYLPSDQTASPTQDVRVVLGTPPATARDTSVIGERGVAVPVGSGAPAAAS